MTRAFIGDNAGARADVEAALKIEPKSVYALHSRGRLELGAERYAEAVKDFDAAQAADPEHGSVYASRSIAYRELERYDRALKDINQALALFPDQPVYLAWKAEIYRRMGDHLQAVEVLDAALKGDPNVASVWWARGLSKAELGDAKGAQADKAQARRLDPKIGA